MAQHILVPTDGSKLSRKAVEAGIAYAKSHAAKITIYHALEPFPLYIRGEPDALNPDFIRTLEAETRQEGERLVADAARVAEQAGVAVDTEIDRPQSPYRGIIDAAKRLGCDLVFIGSHGRSAIAGPLLGNVTQKVLAHIDIPVLVYREPRDQQQ